MYCMFVTMHQATKFKSIPNVKFLMLPPNATSVVQPLDQGIIWSVKRRYKKKVAEIPCECQKQQRCKHTPQAIGYCGSNKHGGQCVEGNEFNYYPELLLQSRVQTPCCGSWPSPWGGTCCPSPRHMEQSSKMDGWCAVWWFCSQWTWGTYNIAYDGWGYY